MKCVKYKSTNGFLFTKNQHDFFDMKSLIIISKSAKESYICLIETRNQWKRKREREIHNHKKNIRLYVSYKIEHDCFNRIGIVCMWKYMLNHVSPRYSWLFFAFHRCTQKSGILFLTGQICKVCENYSIADFTSWCQNLARIRQMPWLFHHWLV